MSSLEVIPSYKCMYLATHGLLPPDLANHVGVLRRQDFLDFLRSMNNGDLTMTRLVAMARGGVSDARYLLSIGAQNIQPSPLLSHEFFKCTGLRLVQNEPLPYCNAFPPQTADTYTYHDPSPQERANEAQYVQAATPARITNAQDLIGRYFQLSYDSHPTHLWYWNAFLLGEHNTSYRLRVGKNGLLRGFFRSDGMGYIIDGTFVDANAPIQVS